MTEAYADPAIFLDDSFEGRDFSEYKPGVLSVEGCVSRLIVSDFFENLCKY